MTHKGITMVGIDMKSSEEGPLSKTKSKDTVIAWCSRLIRNRNTLASIIYASAAYVCISQEAAQQVLLHNEHEPHRISASNTLLLNKRFIQMNDYLFDGSEVAISVA